MPLPGPAALEAILRTHLPPAIPETEIPPLARAALGHSAAHVDAAIRAATSRARGAGRPVGLADLRAALAEKLVFGNVSGGAGGGAECDLAQATRLAVGIEIGLGLGGEGPLWMSLAEAVYLRDPAARSRVHNRLNSAEQRARAELRGRHATLLVTARALHARRVLEGDDLDRWLEALHGAAGEKAAAETRLDARRGMRSKRLCCANGERDSPTTKP